VSTIHEERWRGRPVASACIRLFVVLGPLAAAVATSALVTRALPKAEGAGPLAVRWAISLGASTFVLLTADRAARRLLPLAVLLRLSLAFPNAAPSRFTVARRAGATRDLEARIERARLQGVDDEPTRAAEAILSLVAAVEAHDRATRGHSERVRVYTDLLADQMHLPPSDRDRLRWAALLHDVGKLEVPAKVLNKPAALAAHEWKLVRRHPDEGARLVRPMRSWLGSWALAIEEHHERYDGAGYPRGLAGEAISLGGRIVAVADCYETMTAARPYRRPMSPARAREELVRCSGAHFDPAIVRSFLQVSVRRLGWVAGPLSWLAQAPFLRGLEQVAEVTGRAATTAAAAGGALVIAVAPQPAHPASPSPRAPATARAFPIDSVLATGDGAVATPEGPQPAPSPSPTPSPSPSTQPQPDSSESPSPRPTKDPTPPGARTTVSPSPSSSGGSSATSASFGASGSGKLSATVRIGAR
jgi:putative nucleotidyltransferase with HDIG domain